MIRNLLAVVFATTMAAMATGCGALGGGGGDGGVFCSGDSACKMGEICHPTAKICVTTCSTGNDCPSNSKQCTALAGTTASDGGTVNFCGCASTALCNGSSGGNLVCNDSDKVCFAKCAADTDCPDSRKCDTTTGQCKPKGAAGCSPACTASQVCDTSGSTPTCVAKCTSGSCTGGKVCNTTSGACEAAKACSSANAQPDTCGYGGRCVGSSCSDLTVPTCANFPAGSSPLLWDPATSTGPILYDATDEGTDDAAFCTTTNKAFTVTAKAYRTDTDWPTTLAQVPGFKYYDSTGSFISVIPSIRPSGYVHTGKNASFKITFCAPLSATSITVGLTFDNGNAMCVPLAAGATGTM